MKSYLAYPATHIAKPLKANALAKACQRVWLNQRTDERKESTIAQHCISVMRAKRGKLSIFALNKHIGKLTVKCFEIPHYAYT